LKVGDFAVEVFLGGKYIYIYQILEIDVATSTTLVKMIYSDAIWLDRVDTMRLLMTEGRERRIKILNADEIIFEILQNYNR
jgi:hypothetical protein